MVLIHPIAIVLITNYIHTGHLRGSSLGDSRSYHWAINTLKPPSRLYIVVVSECIWAILGYWQ